MRNLLNPGWSSKFSLWEFLKKTNPAGKIVNVTPVNSSLSITAKLELFTERYLKLDRYGIIWLTQVAEMEILTTQIEIDLT